MSNKVLHNLSRMRKGTRKSKRQTMMKSTRKAIGRSTRKVIMKVMEVSKRVSKMMSKMISKRVSKRVSKTKSKRHTKRHTKHHMKRKAMRGGDYETSIVDDELELVPILKEDSKDLSVSVPGFGTIDMKAYRQYMEDLDRRGPRQM